MDHRLLDLLRCPQTGLRLRPGGPEDAARFGSEADRLLIREDAEAAYPIADGIPLLIPAAVLPPPGAKTTGS